MRVLPHRNMKTTDPRDGVFSGSTRQDACCMTPVFSAGAATSLTPNKHLIIALACSQPRHDTRRPDSAADFVTSLERAQSSLRGNNDEHMQPGCQTYHLHHDIPATTTSLAAGALTSSRTSEERGTTRSLFLERPWNPSLSSCNRRGGPCASGSLSHHSSRASADATETSVGLSAPSLRDSQLLGSSMPSWCAAWMWRVRHVIKSNRAGKITVCPGRVVKQEPAKFRLGGTRRRRGVNCRASWRTSSKSPVTHVQLCTSKVSIISVFQFHGSSSRPAKP